MSIDINYQPPKNTAPEYTIIYENGNINYWYWCEMCQRTHETPWCLMRDYEDSYQVIDRGDTSPLIPYLCPHCGQVLWK